MMILVTGGSGSGKSAFAEDQVVAFGEAERIYIATMFPFDEESRKRVQRHQNMRKGKGFETIECYTGLERVRVPEGSTVLLECMSNLVANEMFPETVGDEINANWVENIVRQIRHLKDQTGHLVIVTNEIFSDGIEYDPETTRYQQYLGEMNCELAKLADVVVEVVYSIPLVKKGTLEGIVSL